MDVQFDFYGRINLSIYEQIIYQIKPHITYDSVHPTDYIFMPIMIIV